MTRKPRIGWLPGTADPKVASYRLRTLRPIEYLRRRGWQVQEWDPTVDFDVVVFQKAYSPEQVDTARALRRRGTRLVLDACDNHLYNPTRAPDLAARAARLREMIDRAHVVTTATPALRDELGVTTALVVGDAMDVRLRAAAAPSSWRRDTGRARLLWFGSAVSPGQHSPMADLARLVPVLDAVNSTHRLRLVIVSNSRTAAAPVRHAAQFPVTYLPWSARTFPHIADSCQLSLLPVTLNSFTRCKTSNRLATSLLSGLAVVADPVPSYEDFRPHVLFGNWDLSIRTYLESPSLRATHVDAGRRAVQRAYAEERVASQWETALTRALDVPSASG